MQSSDLTSRIQRATWQALDPLLHLMNQTDALSLKPEALSQVLLAAAQDVQTIPGDALLALLSTLRCVPLKSVCADPHISMHSLFAVRSRSSTLVLVVLCSRV